jgi:hypothetical protein
MLQLQTQEQLAAQLSSAAQDVTSSAQATSFLRQSAKLFMLLRKIQDELPSVPEN